MASTRGGGLFAYGAPSCFEHVVRDDDDGLWSSRWAAAGAASAPSPLAIQPSAGFPEQEDSEDYTTGLVEQIAQSMLDESEENGIAQDCSLFQKQNFKWNAQTLSTSPQSTLAEVSWDLLSPGASSSGGLSSGVSSPPTPVEASASAASAHVEKDALDLLYAELLRLKMEDEIQARQQQLIKLKQQQQYQQLLWEIRQQQVALMSEASEGYGSGYCSVQLGTPHTASTPGYYFQHTARDDELFKIPARKFVNRENAALSLWYRNAASRQRSGVIGDSTNRNGKKHHGFSNHNHYSATVNGSGMRAVFLSTQGARESSGTGVFLPRPIGGGGSSTDTRRKPACSTVLLPSRIVQALNLNVEDTLGRPAVSSLPMNTRRDHNGASFHHSSVIPSDLAEPLLNKQLPAPNGQLSGFLLQDFGSDVC